MVMTRTTDAHRIVVIGGGYAGMLAAVRAAKRTRKLGAHVTLIDPSESFIERIRLHQLAAGEPFAYRARSEMLRGTGAVFIQGRVESLDPEAQTLSVATAERVQTIAYDTLIYALGSSVDTSLVPGVAEHAHSLGSEAAARALREMLPEAAERGATLVVCGGGLTGIEVSSEIAEAYPSLHVRLLTRGPFGQALSEKGRRHLRGTFDRLGIEIRDHTEVSRVRSGEIVTADGDTIPFDLCLWAGPFGVPALAREAGLAVNARGQALVDPFLRSVSHPSIFVAGDAAAFVEAPGAPIRMACATALPMGAHAADNVTALLCGRPLRPFRFGYVIQCISLGRRNGLVQFVHHDDTPKERIVRGRLAAFVKEQICRLTVWSLRMERRWPGVYTWSKGPAAGAEVPTLTGADGRQTLSGQAGGRG